MQSAGRRQKKKSRRTADVSSHAYGQILAVSEISEGVAEGHENQVQKAYEVLEAGASNTTPVGSCDYSPCQFRLIDKFGVCWCLFV